MNDDGTFIEDNPMICAWCEEDIDECICGSDDGLDDDAFFNTTDI